MASNTQFPPPNNSESNPLFNNNNQPLRGYGSMHGSNTAGIGRSILSNAATNTSQAGTRAQPTAVPINQEVDDFLSNFQIKLDAAKTPDEINFLHIAIGTHLDRIHENDTGRNQKLVDASLQTSKKNHAWRLDNADNLLNEAVKLEKKKTPTFNKKSFYNEINETIRALQGRKESLERVQNQIFTTNDRNDPLSIKSQGKIDQIDQQIEKLKAKLPDDYKDKNRLIDDNDAI